MFQLVGVPHGERTLQITLPDGRQLTKQVYIGGNTELVWDLAYDGYDMWQRRMFTAAERGDPAVSGPDADPDRDGWGNLYEYVFGYDPMRDDVLGHPVWLDTTGGGVRLLFRRAVGISDITYRLRYCTNMLDAVWSQTTVTPAVAGMITNGIEAAEVNMPIPDAPQLFLELRPQR